MQFTRNERGMTLIEMLIAMSLMALVAGVFYQLVVVGVRGWAGMEGVAMYYLLAHPESVGGGVAAFAALFRLAVIVGLHRLFSALKASA